MDGRVVVFEPYINLWGRIVYGLLHHEPIAWKNKINWTAPTDMNPENLDYYTAQGNATKMFFNKKKYLVIIELSHAL